MNRREFYSMLADLPADKDTELVTVTAGQKAGSKYLLTDGRVTACFTGEKDRMEEKLPEDMPAESLLIETMGHRKTLVVCGAGYVGRGVIRLGKFLGFYVIAIDDRIDFAKEAEAAGADMAMAEEFRLALAPGRVPCDEDTFFVVVTRGHRFDRECLLEIMKHDAAYVGMMGSRARSARMRQTLLEEGIDPARADRLHAPIGLKIGAQTPEEIAVSIMAEIVEEKAEVSGKHAFPQDILDKMVQYLPGSCVLATIVGRRGSVPREAGTRMLIGKDRTTAGTIGGGCMEAEVISEALLMMAGDGAEDGSEIFSVDLTGRTGKSADMLCGGTMDLLLEVL